MISAPSYRRLLALTLAMACLASGFKKKYKKHADDPNDIQHLHNHSIINHTSIALKQIQMADTLAETCGAPNDDIGKWHTFFYNCMKAKSRDVMFTDEKDIVDSLGYWQTCCYIHQRCTSNQEENVNCQALFCDCLDAVDVALGQREEICMSKTLPMCHDVAPFQSRFDDVALLSSDVGFVSFSDQRLILGSVGWVTTLLVLLIALISVTYFVLNIIHRLMYYPAVVVDNPPPNDINNNNLKVNKLG